MPMTPPRKRRLSSYDRVKRMAAQTTSNFISGRKARRMGRKVRRNAAEDYRDRGYEGLR